VSEKPSNAATDVPRSAVVWLAAAAVFIAAMVYLMVMAGAYDFILISAGFACGGYWLAKTIKQFAVWRQISKLRKELDEPGT